jgi:hypothetical protein
MHLRVSVLAAATAASLTIPAAASASTLTLPGTCVEQGTSVEMSGSGFTPEYAVQIDGGLSGSAYPEDDGTFKFSGGVPAWEKFIPTTQTVTATDQINPANSTQLSFQLYKFGSNLPVKGNPRQSVSWQFSGYPAGSVIYGHFRRNNKRVGDYRFGRASGACGTLVTRAKRIPFKVKGARTGGWYLQVDNKPTYSYNTRPEFDITF